MKNLVLSAWCLVLGVTTLPAAEANLAPMLDAGVTVPNGGILRLFPNASMKERKQLAETFDESPYKDVQPLRNMRYNWNKL